jgi:DNA-directed RNA polymerase specialized sigma24 family protein
MEGEEVLQSPLSPQKTPAELAVARKSVERRRRIQGLLLEALATLSPEDQLIAKMRGQFSVSEIARALNLEQKPLYHRLERIFESLRSALERMGVSAEDIADIHLGHESDESGK